jgi:hypothetical protein
VPLPDTGDVEGAEHKRAEAELFMLTIAVRKITAAKKRIGLFIGISSKTI